ncbi:hypothetical protein ASPFODRAFT_60014 [Aspergillus luchuensis CBS 106.47]|uniref:Uncharacterized protein n=1 Tax=Aspergillus luchuensis (strain CBS 106.47) TaxID=1137211 RepID=A0A1M3TLG3_ASPLC|nr:hypothetical protein ASPFODRAFT_60014 [Aspergillus luchuensis CBS 106.47]
MSKSYMVVSTPYYVEWIAAFTLPLGLAGIPVGGRKFRALTIDTTADPLPVCESEVRGADMFHSRRIELSSPIGVEFTGLDFICRTKKVGRPSKRRTEKGPCNDGGRDIRSMYMPTRRGIAYAYLHDDDLPRRACGMLMNLGATAPSATLLARNQHAIPVEGLGVEGDEWQPGQRLLDALSQRGSFSEQSLNSNSKRDGNIATADLRSETFANNRGALVNNAPSNPASNLPKIEKGLIIMRLVN